MSTKAPHQMRLVDSRTAPVSAMPSCRTLKVTTRQASVDTTTTKTPTHASHELERRKPWAKSGLMCVSIVRAISQKM